MKLKFKWIYVAGIALTVVGLFGCSKKTVSTKGSDSMQEHTPAGQYPEGFEIPQIGDSFTEFWKNVPKPKSYGFQRLGGTGDCHVCMEFENGSKFACGTNLAGQITYVWLKGEKAPVGVFRENEVPDFSFLRENHDDATRRK